MSSETTSEAPVEPGPEPAPEQPTGMSRRTVIILIVVLCVVLALVAGAFVWYLSTRKPLSQIPLFSQETPPTYSYAMYDVAQPLGVALDETNNRVYVTQSSGDRTVLIFDFDGNKVGALEPPDDGAEMHMPVYVAVDPATAEVYVTDRATGAVNVYDSGGGYLREFRPEGVTAWTPLAVAFGKDGNLYVSDVTEEAQQIWVASTDGKLIRKMGLPDDLAFPNGIAALDEVRVAVSDSNHGRVVVYGGQEAAIGALARGNADAPLGLPRGLAVDDTGRLYVVDTVNHVVRVYKPTDEEAGYIPEYSFSFGEEGSVDGTFEYPNGIAVDSRGRLFITDRENNRVQVWSY